MPEKKGSVWYLFSTTKLSTCEPMHTRMTLTGNTFWPSFNANNGPIHHRTSQINLNYCTWNIFGNHSFGDVHLKTSGSLCVILPIALATCCHMLKVLIYIQIITALLLYSMVIMSDIFQAVTRRFICSDFNISKENYVCVNLFTGLLWPVLMSPSSISIITTSFVGF